MAAYYTGAALAFLRWTQTRDPARRRRGAAARRRVHADQGARARLGADAGARRRRRAAAATGTRYVRSGSASRCSRSPCWRRRSPVDPQLPAASRLRSRVARRSPRRYSCLATGICSGTRALAAALLAWRQLASPSLAPLTRGRGRRRAVPRRRLRLHQRARRGSPSRRRSTARRCTSRRSPSVFTCSRSVRSPRDSPRRRRRAPRPRTARRQSAYRRGQRCSTCRASRCVCVDTANHALALRALAKSREDIRFGRTLFLTDDLPPASPCPRASRSSRIAPTRFARSVFALRLEGAAAVRRDAARAADAVGWLCRQSGGVGPAFLDCDYIGAKWYWHDDGLPRRQRRVLAALAQAARRAAGSAHRPHRGRGHDDRPHVPTAARARARHPLRRRGTGRSLLVRGGVSDRAAVRVPRAVQLLPHRRRRRRSPRSRRRSPTPSRARRSCSRCCATASRWRSGTRRVRSARASSPPCRRHAEAARCSPPRSSVAAQAPRGRSQRSLPLRQRQALQALPRRARTATPRAPRSARPADADARVRDAMAAHQRGDLDAAERGYRAALRGVPEHPMATHYPRRIAVSARDSSRRRCRCSSAAVDRGARASPSSTTTWGSRSRQRTAATKRSPRTGGARAQARTTRSAWNNLGLALQADNRLPEAIDAFRARDRARPRFRAGALEPRRSRSSRTASSPRAGANTSGGSSCRSSRASARVRRRAGTARDAAGRTLLVTAEQGLGDTLQFIRFAQPLAARGARVVVSAPAPARPAARDRARRRAPFAAATTRCLRTMRMLPLLVARRRARLTPDVDSRDACRILPPTQRGARRSRHALARARRRSQGRPRVVGQPRATR